MVDRDLANLYQVKTGVLNQAVKRNIARFPKDFRFQLTGEEFRNWKSQSVISKQDKIGLRKIPFVFTEQGVAMLSVVLRSSTAIDVSIKIMNAFVEMRKLISSQSIFLNRIEKIERNQFEADQKFEHVFKALESKNLEPDQGIFFDGQVFDAYAFVSKLIRSAKENIILIDNYIDETTLMHLTKKKKEVNAIILTKTISKQLTQDLKKVNDQYGLFKIKEFTKSHDRFLIIDGIDVYHLGASLKDLGKKWFAFSKLNKNSVKNIMDAIQESI